MIYGLTRPILFYENLQCVKIDMITYLSDVYWRVNYGPVPETYTRFTYYKQKPTWSDSHEG